MFFVLTGKICDLIYSLFFTVSRFFGWQPNIIERVLVKTVRALHRDTQLGQHSNEAQGRD